MRCARKKMIGRSCYYHCCARIAGDRKSYPFTEIDKEKGLSIVLDLSRLYLIEPISISWMGNHWHIVLCAPGDKPGLEETVYRYNSYYGKGHKHLNVEIDHDECERVSERLIDISSFMGQIHQKFTFYINKTHDRGGTLWADRFKSSILEDGNALWSCVKYVELNSVRAGLVNHPADYRFSSWGHYCGTGKHIFGDNFTRHMRRYIGDIAKDWTDDEVNAEFRSRLARAMASEAGGSVEEVRKAGECAKEKESMPIRFLRRTRHWTDGAIIGTKVFVQEVAIMFEDKERIMKKQLSSGTTPDGVLMHCFKRLRVNLN